MAARILAGLTELDEAIRKGTPLEKKFTVRTVDLVLKPQDFSPQDIKDLREKLGASQGIFAAVMGVAVESVESWEQGRQKPSPLALRMMHLLKQNPGLFLSQIKLKETHQTV